jgi:hypothetical protein
MTVAEIGNKETRRLDTLYNSSTTLLPRKMTSSHSSKTSNNSAKSNPKTTHCKTPGQEKKASDQDSIDISEDEEENQSSQGDGDEASSVRSAGANTDTDEGPQT